MTSLCQLGAARTLVTFGKSAASAIAILKTLNAALLKCQASASLRAVASCRAEYCGLLLRAAAPLVVAYVSLTSRIQLRKTIIE